MIESADRETMSLVFCRECWSWTLPRDERCSDCQARVGSHDAEPCDPETLRPALGELVSRIGEVQLKRHLLPDAGTLYATTTGLLFVPHRLDHVTRLVDKPTPGSSLVWSIAALVWSPLAFLLPLLQTKKKQKVQMPVLRPVFLAPRESGVLPELLLTNPGVVFVRKREMRMLARGRRSWRVDRLHGRPLQLRPTADRARFNQRLDKVLDSPGWQDVTVT